MKSIKFSQLLFMVVVLFSVACKKASKSTVNAANTTKEFVAVFGPKTQTVSINPSIDNTFTLKGGTKITIPANAFSLGTNTPSESITIEAMEMLKRSDVLFSGTNTNHISGAPLVSDGFIYLKASINGVKLPKTTLKPIIIAIPTNRTGSTQIWEGVEKVGENEQMAWQAPEIKNPMGGGAQREVSAVDGAFTFNMGNLGWINCDVFYSYSNPKTTTTVELLNNPGGLASFRGFSGETFVFFCAKGSNVAAQLYTPNGPNKVKSYDNVMPVGALGKYLSFSIKDGKYYYAELETTITANQNITLNLTETTEIQIQTAINSLNTY